MDKNDMQELEVLLHKERDRLLKLVERTARHLYRREEPYSADFAEQAVETQNNEVVEQLDRESQAELQLIEKALQRIEEGHYGRCIECGEAINVERLKAVPTADRCIDCAST